LVRPPEEASLACDHHSKSEYRWSLACLVALAGLPSACAVPDPGRLG